MNEVVSLELAECLMEKALTCAREAEQRGEVPIGAVIATFSGEVIGAAGNRAKETGDPTAHAEMLAIGQVAGKNMNVRSTPLIICATVEPCIMCAGAILLTRFSVVIWGAAERQTGAFGSVIDLSVGGDGVVYHTPRIISGIRATETKSLLATFFQERRALLAR